MNFNEFFISTESLSIDFSKKEENDINSEGLLKNEALFQLPLIWLIVLLLAKDKRKPFILEIGQIVGECIEGSFYGFKGSAQHLGWSANLRIRTIKAVNFLEATKLIEVNIKNKKLDKRIDVIRPPLHQFYSFFKVLSIVVYTFCSFFDMC